MRQDVSRGITSECRNVRPWESNGSGPVELRCNEGQKAEGLRKHNEKTEAERDGTNVHWTRRVGRPLVGTCCSSSTVNVSVRSRLSKIALLDLPACSGYSDQSS